MHKECINFNEFLNGLLNQILPVPQLLPGCKLCKYTSCFNSFRTPGYHLASSYSGEQIHCVWEETKTIL